VSVSGKKAYLAAQRWAPWLLAADARCWHLRVDLRNHNSRIFKPPARGRPGGPAGRDLYSYSATPEFRPEVIVCVRYITGPHAGAPASARPSFACSTQLTHNRRQGQRQHAIRPESFSEVRDSPPRWSAPADALIRGATPPSNASYAIDRSLSVSRRWAPGRPQRAIKPVPHNENTADIGEIASICRTLRHP